MGYRKLPAAYPKRISDNVQNQEDSPSNGLEVWGIRHRDAFRDRHKANPNECEI